MIFIPLYYLFGFYRTPLGYDHICYDLTAGKDWFLSETRLDAEIYYRRSALSDVGFRPTSPKETVPRLTTYLREFIKFKQENVPDGHKDRETKRLLETNIDDIAPESSVRIRGVFVDRSTIYKAYTDVYNDDETPFDQQPANKVVKESLDVPIKKRILICTGIEAVCNVFYWRVEFEPQGDNDPDTVIFDSLSDNYDKQLDFDYHKLSHIHMDYAVVGPPVHHFSKEGGYQRQVLRRSIDADVGPNGRVFGKRFTQVVPLDGYGQPSLDYKERSWIGLLPENLMEARANHKTSEKVIYYLLDWV